MTLSHSPSIVRDGLVLYLDAANTKSYPGSGTTWYDLSGNGNNGTMTSVSYSSIRGGVITFPGTAANVEFDGPIPTGSPFSISCWYYPTRINTSYDIIYSGTDNIDLQLYFHASSKNLWTSVENVEKSTSFTLTNETINKWYNIVWTYNYSSRIVYLNGESISFVADSTAFTKNDSRVRLGALLNPGSYTLAGDLPVFHAYTRAITEEEVKQNFNALRGRYGI